jgi:hypothetical protein
MGINAVILKFPKLLNYLAHIRQNILPYVTSEAKVSSASVSHT